MSPEQRQINELEAQVDSLQREMDSLKSAAMIDPQVPRAIGLRLAFISKVSTGGTSGINETVTDTNGGLSTDYIVAKDYAGSMIVTDANGVEYKLGYYNP